MKVKDLIGVLLKLDGDTHVAISVKGAFYPIERVRPGMDIFFPSKVAALFRDKLAVIDVDMSDG